VNWDHLEAVTKRENVLRGVGATAVNARRTHCKNGHPFNVGNTYRAPGGGRHCRSCNNMAAGAYRNRIRVLN
jgi:hypothetical protein